MSSEEEQFEDDFPVADNALFTSAKKALRPETFDDYIGQTQVVKRLKKHVEAELIRREREPDSVFDHIVFEGRSGLGKTSISYVIANELGVNIRVMQAKTIEKTGDIVANLVHLEEGDILFIDEIHALPKDLVELIYSVMEDFRLDITTEGRTVNMSLVPFTLIGATTDFGKLPLPFQERFVHRLTLQKYEDSDLAKIISANAVTLGYSIEPDAAEFMASRSKGVPRVANNLLKKIRNYAEFNNMNISKDVVEEAFSDEGIHEYGIDTLDLKYLRYLDGVSRPVGLKTISTSIGIDEATLDSSIEPYLLESGFVEKSARGRILTESGKALTEQLS